MLTENDFVIMTWEEYEGHIKALSEKISAFLAEYGEKIDIIVPVLRGGGIPAISIAYKLEVVAMRCIQMKHDYKSKSINILSNELTSLPEPNAPYTILLVDGYHASGRTAYMAYDMIRSALPNAKIIYATIGRDVGYLKDEREFLYSCHSLTSNECGVIPKEISEAEGMLTKYTLFPWESLEDELCNMNDELIYGG